METEPLRRILERQLRRLRDAAGTGTAEAERVKAMRMALGAKRVLRAGTLWTTEAAIEAKAEEAMTARREKDNHRRRERRRRLKAEAQRQAKLDADANADADADAPAQAGEGPDENNPA